MKMSIIQYQDLKRWDAKYQAVIRWYWDKSYIRRIGEVLKRKKKLMAMAHSLPLLSIHFDGSMTERPANTIKGNIYIANNGNLVYSKIDLRNGAIGIIPDTYKAVGFTSEFPIYEVCEQLVDREYMKLVLHSKNFRTYINGLVSGTSGRKRVNPDNLESIPIPVPNISIQREIIHFWKNTQQNSFELDTQADEREKQIELVLLQELGFQKKEFKKQKGPFVIHINEMERWDTFFFRQEFRDTLDQIRQIGGLPLGECAKFVSRKWTKSDFPSGTFNYIQISDVNKDSGILGSSKVEAKKAPSRATQIVKQDDILIATTRPYLAAFTKVNPEYDGSIASSGFAVIEETINKLDKDYLLLFLKSYPGLKQFEQRMTGGLYPAIVQTELEKILIPLPLLERQKEIVERVKMEQENVRSLRRMANDLLTIAREDLESVIIGERNIDEVTEDGKE